LDGFINVGSGDADDQFTTDPKVSPIRFRTSPSSYSSMSAEPEPLIESPIPSPHAEEMEWEASLQPHQRALHDLLVRTTKRVMRHIVDNETAVTDIAYIFAKDGEHVLNSFMQQHIVDYDCVFGDMVGKIASLHKELEKAAQYIANERIKVRAIV
jgi:hypothetical protein